MKIEPTVGRVVHLHHHSFPGALLAASIAAVNENGTINVGFLSPSGGHHAAENVPLVQDGEARWMPYQKGQAAKTEQLEQKLAGTAGDLPAGAGEVSAVATDGGMAAADAAHGGPTPA